MIFYEFLIDKPKETISSIIVNNVELCHVINKVDKESMYYKIYIKSPEFLCHKLSISEIKNYVKIINEL